MKNQKRKNIIVYIMVLTLSIALISALPIHGEEELYENVVRLHVLANSDSEEDQALKLKVRDRLLEEFSAELSEYDNREGASEHINSILDKIWQCATSAVEEAGYSYGVEVSFTREYYQRRIYETLTMPAGTYYSLKITIGEGEGKNWWCVLYPPVCLSAAKGEIVGGTGSLPAGLTKEQYKILTESGDVQYKLKFKILELLEKKMGK